MAVWQKASGSCIGRGFDAAGYCGLFKAWVVTPVLSGGPAWYIIDDQSALLNNPYIVVCNMATPNFNTDRAKFIRLLLPTGSSGVVWVYHYLWWDPATNTGSTLFSMGRVTTVDAGTFVYDFRGGEHGLCLQSRIGSTWSRSFLGTWTGDANLVDPVTVNGTLTGTNFTESGDTGNQLSGYASMTGVRDTNTDATGTLYFSLVNTTGTTYRIDVYKDSARTSPNLVAQTSTFTNTSTGAKTLTAQNSSGIGGTITLSATATATTSISCQFNRLTLGLGEGAQFTVGHFYFIYGFTGNRNIVSYAKVVGISGDTLAFDFLGAKTFASGDVINPYPFRVFGFHSSSYDPVLSSTLGANLFFLPFQSLQGGEFTAISSPGGGNAGPYADIDYLGSVLGIMDTDDESLYAVMQPVIYEARAAASSSSVGNRAYGTLDDFWVTSTAGMAEMQDGRRIGSVDYIYCGNFTGAFALLVRDTTSLS